MFSGTATPHASASPISTGICCTWPNVLTRCKRSIMGALPAAIRKSCILNSIRSRSACVSADGASASRFGEEKRVVKAKEVGPLISTKEMTRCIHCTRCVRFGQEIGGVMEFGMSNRGEWSEIETFVGQSVDSELSGNMIDLCPVGALTSMPFRYSARTWELSRRRSVSPHDSTGANLVVQVKNNRVMRVVPLENEQVNECWIADRDRFSYEALNSDERLAKPMLKQGGEWKEVDWQTAL